MTPDTVGTAAGVVVDAAFLSRWIGYLALLTLIGAAVFLPLARSVLTPALAERLGPGLLARTRALALGAAVLLLLADFGRLYGQAMAFLDPGESLSVEAVRPIVTASSWGRGWLIQLAAGGIALIGWAVAGRRRSWGQRIGAAASLGAAATAPFTGHAVEHPWGAMAGLALHAVHLLAGGAWLGTLFLVVAVAFPVTRDLPGEERAAVMSRLIAGFSRIAQVSVVLLALAGLTLALVYVGSWKAVLTTDYGTTLLIKTAFVMIALALGAWNWKRLTPRLGEATGLRALGRSAGAELVIGALVLLVTAGFVALGAPSLGHT
ncbi:MAG: copper resistance D family protein [Gemmatimonadota bacterium]